MQLAGGDGLGRPTLFPSFVELDQEPHVDVVSLGDEKEAARPLEGDPGGLDRPLGEDDVGADECHHIGRGACVGLLEHIRHERRSEGVGLDLAHQLHVQAAEHVRGAGFIAE